MDGGWEVRNTRALALVVLTLGLVCGRGLAQTGGPSPGPCPIFHGACDVPPLESIRMVDALTGWAVTHGYDASLLLRTTDGGVHWKDVTPLSAAGQKINVRAVYALTSLIAWAGSFHTVDGGETWRPVVLPARGGMGTLHFINASEGWMLSLGAAAMGSVEAYVYRSTDEGENWIEVASAESQDVGSGLPFSGVKGSITFLNATTGWITGGHGIAPNVFFLYKTRDAGRTWQEQKLPLPPEATSRWSSWTYPPKFFTSHRGILPVFFSYNYDVGGAWVILFYITHDGGATWTHTGPVSVGQWGNPYDFVDMDHGWASDGGALYTTMNGGHQWQAMHPTQPFADIKQLDFMSPQFGWAITKISPYLLKTVDGGRTWTPMPYTISGK